MSPFIHDTDDPHEVLATIVIVVLMAGIIWLVA